MQTKKAVKRMLKFLFNSKNAVNLPFTKKKTALLPFFKKNKKIKRIRRLKRRKRQKFFFRNRIKRSFYYN